MSSLDSDVDWLQRAPTFSSTEFEPKKSTYCVCVFVINEGGRLLKQLADMVPSSSAVDIVVGDGGSTDGSTDASALTDRRVNTLLVNRDQKGLGTQMRMAFAWALHRGYEGVITMDGNGKDGVEAISRFIDALAAGYDHVQGSRFIPGGVSKNLPLARLLGVRAIHAPLLARCAGFKYTDTTNGFRAYSARFLTDPTVGVFRNVFRGYELHYYLAVQAAKRGYRIVEVPVSRCYPDRGPLPTKIPALTGNLGILYALFATCFGRFDVKRIGGKSPQKAALE